MYWQGSRGRGEVREVRERGRKGEGRQYSVQCCGRDREGLRVIYPSPPSLSLSPSHLYLFAVLQGLHNGFVCRASQHPLQLGHLLSVSPVMPCQEGERWRRKRKRYNTRKFGERKEEAGTGNGRLRLHKRVVCHTARQQIAADVSTPSLVSSVIS
jgi:hypothetical protein